MRCPACARKTEHCICDLASILPSRTRVLVLQHPQEPDEVLGSAALLVRSLPGGVLRVGLSWPNLAKALGEPAEASKWAVLYLGTKEQAGNPSQPGAVWTTGKGKPVEPGFVPEGIVALDGTWAQAKAIWWRNAWLTKLKRVAITPRQRSLYGNLRREPRRECVSTLEAVAEVMDALGEPPEVTAGLRTSFSAMLDRYRRKPRPEAPPATSTPADVKATDAG
jgi:DTW domain-containing protein YfiP